MTEATPDRDSRSPWPPAPGDLRIVEAFLNTLVPKSGSDELSSLWRLNEWLTRHRLLGEAAAEDDDLRRAREVREALRALLAARDGAALGDGAVELLDRAGSRGRMHVRFGPDGRGRYESAARTFDDALGQLLGIVVAAQNDGTWSRLKRCEACHKVFYDASRARRGKWCSSLCGGRVRGRAFRRRQ